MQDDETCSSTFDSLSITARLPLSLTCWTWILHLHYINVSQTVSSPLLWTIVSSCRYSLLRHSKERQKVDGLNNLNYSPLVSRRPLYTNITVSLSRKLAPIADYWCRHSWTAKTHLGIKVLWDISHISPVAALLRTFQLILCFVFVCMQKKRKNRRLK